MRNAPIERKEALLQIVYKGQGSRIYESFLLLLNVDISSNFIQVWFTFKYNNIDPSSIDFESHQAMPLEYFDKTDRPNLPLHPRVQPSAVHFHSSSLQFHQPLPIKTEITE